MVEEILDRAKKVLFIFIGEKKKSRITSLIQLAS